jgi:c-di-GMP-binding flagellar brake protein YcgR
MSVGYTNPERRKFRREKAHFTILYRITQPPEVIMDVGMRELEGVMLDISAGGMALVMTSDVPQGTRIVLRWTLVDPHAQSDDRIRDFQVEGEVRNSVRVRKDEIRLGIAFVGVGEGDRRAIEQFIEHNPRRSRGGGV